MNKLLVGVVVGAMFCVGCATMDWNTLMAQKDLSGSFELTRTGLVVNAKLGEAVLGRETIKFNAAKGPNAPSIRTEAVHSIEEGVHETTEIAVTSTDTD